MKQLAARLLEWRIARYSIASATGTFVDIGSLYLLYSAGLAAGIAAGCGYAMGTIAHWLVSSRFVFPDRLSDAGLKRGRQQLLFVASAVIGIGVTAVIVDAGITAGAPLWLAKGAAMAASFALVFMIRLTIVFRAQL